MSSEIETHYGCGWMYRPQPGMNHFDVTRRTGPVGRNPNDFSGVKIETIFETDFSPEDYPNGSDDIRFFYQAAAVILRDALGREPKGSEVKTLAKFGKTKGDNGAWRFVHISKEDVLKCVGATDTSQIEMGLF